MSVKQTMGQTDGSGGSCPRVERVKQCFLCILAFSHLAAFSSLYLQWPGLYGPHGVMPAHQANPNGFSVITLSDIFNLPLQQTAELVCLAGTVLAGVLIAFPVLRVSPAYAILGALYFSLYQVGRTFLWFQWDILLLETTVLSVLVAPLLPSQNSLPHDNVTLWLIRWLAFRLMFASGVVKLTSGCPSWWGLTALNWHYESQCIPTPLSWYVHQLPACFHKLGVVGTYIIEIIFPFFFFAPVAALRAIAVYAQVFLMFNIMMTGNYNFFNIITVGLCICSLDEAWLPNASTLASYFSPTFGGLGALVSLIKLPIKLAVGAVTWPYRLVTGQCTPSSAVSTASALGMLLFTVWLMRVVFGVGVEGVCAHVSFDRPVFANFLSHAVPLAIVLGLLSLLVNIARAYLYTLHNAHKSRILKVGELLQTTIVSLVVVSLFGISLVPLTELDQDTANLVPLSVQELYHKTRPYHVTNSYGLFRSMTGIGGRPEVVLEGSDRHDGDWEEYNFRYKPGALNHRPPVNTPHQPRLDWQMWFAALGSYDYNPWIINLAYRLLDNSTAVLDLLDQAPFSGGHPPKFIRAVKYRYHYTKSHNVTSWWTRDSKEQYFPPLALYQPTLQEFLKYHGYLVPLSEAHKNQEIVPYLDLLRSLSKLSDPAVLIWSLCVLAGLPHLKAVRCRCTLFGV